MREISFDEAVENFVQRQTPENAIALTNSCKNFILRHAASWRAPDLSSFEKIRELMTEMFLILIEDFQPELCSSGFSILSYLNLRLRRLTRPKRSKTIAFGLSGDFADLGRYNFSPFRMQLTNEIVAAIRVVLANQDELQAGLLEFLFIHIFPEIAWASRLIAQSTGEDHLARHEADRKRHQKFNSQLKNAFARLQTGDWREISEWSGGERSHLAWRIVDLHAAEIGTSLDNELQAFDGWRETFDKRQHYPEKFTTAIALYRALKNKWKKQDSLELVAEDAAIYGEEFDLIGALVGRVGFAGSVQEEAEDFVTDPDDDSSDAQTGLFDSDFARASAEVSEWLNRVLIAADN